MLESDLLTWVLRPRANAFDLLVVMIGLGLFFEGHIILAFIGSFLGGVMSAAGKKYILKSDELKGFDEWFDEYSKQNYTDEMLAEAAWKQGRINKTK